MKIKISKLDRLFSLYIRGRAKWKCERCGRQFQPGDAGLHCSHFHGRRKKSVRWHSLNAASLCFGCHRYYTENPAAHTEWFKKRLGEEAFDALLLQANIGRPEDPVLTEMALKQLLKNMAGQSD